MTVIKMLVDGKVTHNKSPQQNAEFHIKSAVLVNKILIDLCSKFLNFTEANSFLQLKHRYPPYSHPLLTKVIGQFFDTHTIHHTFMSSVYLKNSVHCFL